MSVRFKVAGYLLPNSRVSLLALVCVLAILPAGLVRAETAPFTNGPKTIASKERVSVTIDREVKDSKSFIVLKISVPTDSKTNAFLLADPTRLVVDFEGASIKKSENFPAPENGVIKQIRLGAHPSKLRVVIDLAQTPAPQYDLKSEKRQAIITFVEGPAPSTPAAVPPALPTAAPATSAAPESTPTSAVTPTPPAPVATTQPTAATTDTGAQQAAASAAVAAGAAAASADGLQASEGEDDSDLGDLEASRSGPPPTPLPTTFKIKGYKFEYLPDRSPVLKIVLNKPLAQAQISKIDSETYSISIKDCGVENEDLELPQFPPHDFLGFVMVVAEVVGKNMEVSVSVEEDTVLGTSVHENEIWVKKP